MEPLLLSTTVLASFLGGVVALLAPCCVSVMLPAYFASTFHRRSRILAMTFVFAAGVGSTILPIALGASAVSRLVLGQHTLVYSIGGGAMIAGGLAMLAGWKFMLPMPGRAVRGGSGVGSVYSLGLFSGVASACCAPVLAGVVALSGASASFVTALVVGVAYVFGMVAPLAVLALVWDRKDWGSSTLLSGRTVTIRVGRLRRSPPLGSALSGGVLVAMGAITVVLAFRPPQPPTDGWQVRLSAWLNHQVSVLLDAFALVPGWVGTLVVLGALSGLLVLAFGRRRGHPSPPGAVPDDHASGWDEAEDSRSVEKI